LAARGLIELPAPRIVSPNRFRHLPVNPVDHDTTAIVATLSALHPLQLLDVYKPPHASLFAWLLARYHYLSFKQPVGENMAYLVAPLPVCFSAPLPGVARLATSILAGALGSVVSGSIF
jgi:hypothetical protein